MNWVSMNFLEYIQVNIEISKEFAFNLIVDMEDAINLYESKTLNDIEYLNFIKIKENLFEFKKLYLKNR